MLEQLLESHPDGALVLLLQKWLSAHRVAQGLGGLSEDDPAWIAAMDAITSAEIEIASAPAAGLIGICVKFYLFSHCYFDTPAGAPWTAIEIPPADPDGAVDEQLLRGLAADALRLVPELALLADGRSA